MSRRSPFAFEARPDDPKPGRAAGRPARRRAGSLAGLLAGAAWLGLVGTVHAADDALACPSPNVRQWTERAMRADCETCWAGATLAAAKGPSGRNASTIDWIAPAGGDAPMALAALPEATERFSADLVAGAPVQRRHSLPSSAPVKLTVHTGPGWKGYVAVEMVASRAGRGTLPVGAQAYVALTEDIAAGTEGTAVERHLVRAVVGPLPLDDLASGTGRIAHVHALNVPESAKPERLGSVAWIETPAGVVIAAANAIPDGCPGAP